MTKKIWFTSALLLASASLAPAVADDVTTLKAQIEALNHKMAELEKAQKKSEEAAKEAAIRAAKQEVATSATLSSSQAPASTNKWPTGYIDIPGANTALKFGGFAKADFIYDANGPTGGDALDPKNMPVPGLSADAQRSGQLRAHARGTRLNFETLTHTEKGDLKTFVEMDFFGTQSGNGTSYTPRLRHAYGEYCGFLIGQTFSVFTDLDAGGSASLDTNGLFDQSRRQLQVRYTKDLTSAVNLKLALEKPDSDFQVNTNTGPTNLDNDTAGTGNFANVKGNSSLPDATMALRYTGNMGYIALRGMMRQVGVKSTNITNSSGTVIGNNAYAAKTMGWALGLSGKFNLYKNTAMFAQINGGDAASRYILGSEYTSAIYYDNANATSSVRSLNKRRAYNFIWGMEQKWTSEWRSNLALSHTRITTPSGLLTDSVGGQDNAYGTGAYFNTKVQTGLVNLIYSPTKKVDVGVEVARVRREVVRKNTATTVDTKAADGTRVQFVAMYKF